MKLNYFWSDTFGNHLLLIVFGFDGKRNCWLKKWKFRWSDSVSFLVIFIFFGSKFILPKINSIAILQASVLSILVAWNIYSVEYSIFQRKWKICRCSNSWRDWLHFEALAKYEYFKFDLNGEMRANWHKHNKYKWNDGRTMSW